MEYWSIGKKPDSYLAYFDDIGMKVDTPAGIFTLFQYSSTPLLQHSIWFVKNNPLLGVTKAGPTVPDISKFREIICIFSSR